MSLTTITAQTGLGTTMPANLRGTISVDLSAPANAPAGYAVGLAGMLDNSSPGGYGMVFGYGVPAGMRVDASATGSTKVGGNNYNSMFVKVVADSNQRGSTVQYWEVWFNQSDVDSSNWSTQVQMSINGTTYTYTLTKKRTGDDL